MTSRLHLFGRPRFAGDAGGAELAPERRWQVLAFLAHKKAWVARSELAALFWPAHASRLAQANVRKVLFRLQSGPWGHLLELSGGAVRVAVPTDAADFELALQQGRLEDAVALRSGEFLAGFDDATSEAWDQWLGFERERLATAWRSAATTLLAGDMAPGPALALASRLREADPLDEDALGAQMRWLAASGQAGAARRAFQDHAARLSQEYGLAPGPQLRALREALDGPSPAPALRVPDPAPSSEDFIGRTTELDGLATLLADPRYRLVSLVGPGGVGKTRLARRALAASQARFEHGGTFVALEDLSVPADLPGRLARELGLAGNTEPLEQVTRHLRERELLLVLDNFEQIAGAAWLLERLLRDCPRLRMVVTTRVRLGSAAEWPVPVEGLPCPDPEDADRLDAFDAARLFIRTATRFEPAFLPQAEALAIVGICREVDGLPLALEMAGAWVRLASCATILDQLRSGTAQLSRADTGHPDRQASMEAVFQHSWDLLGAAEREAVARLSVFRGGFTPEAAAAVAGADMPVLAALVDKSLLRKQGARLSHHPLVLQFAARRLGDGPGRDAAAAAHARYYHRLLAQSLRGAETGDQATLERLDTEFENARAAWQWAVEGGDTAALARSAYTLRSHCDARGRWQEGLALLRQAVPCRVAEPDPRFEPIVLSAMAHLAYRLDRFNEAIGLAQEALTAAKRIDERDARLQCEKVLAGCALRLARYGDARRHYAAALRLAPDPRHAAAMLDNLALVEKACGRWEQALEMSNRALAQFRGIGDVAGEALCLNNIGALLGDHGREEAGLAHLQAGLALCRRHGLDPTRAILLSNLAEAGLRTGRLDEADRHAEEAIALARAVGNRSIEGWVTLFCAQIALARQDAAMARRHLQEGASLALAAGRPAGQLLGVLVFADLAEAQGERAVARRLLQFAAAHPGLPASERDPIRKRLLARPGADLPPLPPGRLHELVHRIALEAAQDHAPLLAELRAA